MTTLGLGSRQALDDDVQAAVGGAGHLPDGRDGPDSPHIVGLGVVRRVAVLKRQEQQPVAGQRAIHRLHGRRPVDGEGLERQRENDQLPERDDGELARVGADGVGHCKRVYSIG